MKVLENCLRRCIRLSERVSVRVCEYEPRIEIDGKCGMDRMGEHGWGRVCVTVGKWVLEEQSELKPEFGNVRQTD